MCQVANRAVLAGELLAHVLMSGAHGGRPVTLLGYSMGARCAACPPPEPEYSMHACGPLLSPCLQPMQWEKLLLFGQDMALDMPCLLYARQTSLTVWVCDAWLLALFF
jgi:hypothetical protein